MSSIDKLSIQGIRSFSPEKSETIAFGSPLTLICGQNGCGKTTIIECLKYATTGMLPPNSKGGAFINDPNISKKSLINGQIKLSIVSCDNQRMIITRSMQLMKRGKDKTTFKTLENQLSKYNKKERIDMLSKNSDLDNELPHILGISKAILDYVIFCHQDESLWPLSEPSQLKKKFDDIFEASKFTKVLDNLKLLNKDLSVEIKLLEKSVDHLKVDKTRANKIFKHLEDLKGQIDTLNEEIAHLALQATHHEQELDTLYNSNQDFQKILSQYDQLLFTKKSLTQQLSRLESSIEVLPDDLDTLNDKLNNFNDVLAEHNDKIKQLLNKNNDLNKLVQGKRDELGRLNKVQGSLAVKQTQYEENKNQINQITNSQDHHTFRKELESSIETFNAVYDDTKSENDKLRSEHNTKLQTLNDSINSQNNAKSYKLDSVKEQKAKIKELNDKIKSLNLDETSLNNERNELETLNEKYANSKTSKFLENLVKEILDNSDTLNQLEQEFEDLNKKIQLYNNQNDLFNKINYLKQTISGLKATQDKNLQKIGSVLSQAVTEEDFEQIFNNKYKKIETEFNESKATFDKATSEDRSLTTSIELSTKKLDDLNADLASCKERILKVLTLDEIKDYKAILAELELDYQDTLESLKTFEISKQFKIRAIEIGKKSHSCTLCQRSFDDKQLTGFVKLLQDDLNKMSIGQLDEELKEAKHNFELMKSIGSDIYKFNSLTTEIEDADTKLNQLKQSKKDTELKEMNQTLSQKQSDINELNDVKYLVNEIKTTKTQVEASTNKLNSLTMELDEFDLDKDLSIDELNKAQSDKLLEIKNLRIKVNSSTTLKEQKEKEMYKLSHSIKDKEILIKNMETDLNDYKNYQNLISEYNNSISRLEQEVGSLDKKIQELVDQKKSHITEMDQVFEQMLEDENNKLTELNELKSRLASVSSLISAIEGFESNDEPLIKENSLQIEQLEQEMSDINKQVSDNTSQLKLHETKVHESSNLKSGIRDNIDFKNYQMELGNVEDQMSEIDVKQAEFNRDKYQQDSKNLRGVISELSGENSSKVGQVKQINEQIKSLQKELNEEYKDIDDNYYEKWIELQTNLLISNDLVTYSKSVDRAIMEFHSIKMKEINKILRELWVATYKGTDIDYIAIKSDSNDQAKTTTNRSYNYRVVMYKFGTELDMRGRCSAGQKVLTSILIRLALAECFGSNCGIIALDEPTTNLDLENTESLAESLNKIIEFRKDQKNFQLIVITHDEKFLSLINGDSFADSFFKVERDENQYSVIKNLPIYYIQDE